jgi:phosphotriesterase-related protein
VGEAKVETVLGPIRPDAMGITLIHEHMVFGFPGWQGDYSMAPLDWNAIRGKGIELLSCLRSLGVETVIDATPNDMGRNPRLLKELSEGAGVHIVCSTGFYNETKGASAYFKFRNTFGNAIEEIFDLFMKEIVIGIEDTGIRPGVIKLASSKGEITEYESMFFKAAARVQRETGIPIMTHTEENTMGMEQAELLQAGGVDPTKVVIGHMGDNTDLSYLLRVLDKGFFIAFDRMGMQGRAGCLFDSERYIHIVELIQSGYEEKLMLSHDYIANWLGRPVVFPDALQSLMVNWHPSHVLKNVVPALKMLGVTEAQVKTILVDNPRRLFES